MKLKAKWQLNDPPIEFDEFQRMLSETMDYVIQACMPLMLIERDGIVTACVMTPAERTEMTLNVLSGSV